ncbi:hypothetical protein MASR1M45_15800 [Candidatus Kapaibacterium sp.]
MKYLYLIVLLLSGLFISNCEKKEIIEEATMSESHKAVIEKLNQYAPIDLKVDISHLSDREKQLIQKLIEAGRIVDNIFWKQASHDAIATRDSLMMQNPTKLKIS